MTDVDFNVDKIKAITVSVLALSIFKSRIVYDSPTPAFYDDECILVGLRSVFIGNIAVLDHLCKSFWLNGNEVAIGLGTMVLFWVEVTGVFNGCVERLVFM